ncbi:hypothetical protein TanjilG_27389 [Lupinus angustifolius]|uniref:Myb-like domain-containing protein n=1 Tax=Lupinus angustifolius TaxID=3871 RepID=A0A1J7GYM1_LUPAN|nr:PREDICTED: uncharacterized protein LOC109333117 [Lupinus angustifolius]XP_019423946.1 PREDICTED: uncharacterized protein LOC109333117 [Lupinus angustifolius]OIV93210.1 hypothetical protein TanjilG_27389 [Lupinus angustifolius]
MGYKRCLEVNEFEELSLNNAKRLESNSELLSLTDNPFVKSVICGHNEDGFYNIQWYDTIQADTASEALPAGDMNVQTSGHFGSWSSEDDAGSGATSLSSVSSDCLEFDIPQKSYAPLDDIYSAPDCSPRKPVPIGPNHQAVIPVWSRKVNKIPNLGIYSVDSPSSGLVPDHAAHDNEERLMGTSVLPMPDSSLHYSSKGYKGVDGKSECNCLDQGSIRCVRHHVREARENMRKTIGMENFINLGFCDMGEEIALKWSEEEEEVFHEVVYGNPASLGRNFWKHLSAAFPSRTSKEIVSFYFNVFILQRRAAQNRSRFLDIDSDNDECDTSNPQFYGCENSEDDSGIESLDDQDVRLENLDYSDEDDGNSDDGNEFAGYNMVSITEEGDEIDQRSSKCKSNSQNESWSNPIQHLDGTQGILNDDFSANDDSCTSFECDANIDMSCCSHGLQDASSAPQATEFICEQTPCMPDKLDLCSHEVEYIYLLEPENGEDCYPGYSTRLDTNIDLLPTSNLIEEFFGIGTPDRKT